MDANDRFKSTYQSDRGAPDHFPASDQMKRDFDNLPSPRVLSGVDAYRQGDAKKSGNTMFQRKHSGS